MIAPVPFEQIVENSQQQKMLSRELRQQHQELKIENRLHHVTTALLKAESCLLREQQRALKRQRTLMQLELSLALSQEHANLRLQLASLLKARRYRFNIDLIED